MRVPAVGEEFGRYRLDRVLGQGGMGIVFAATDLRLHRTVALKVITGALADSPEFRSRFQSEAEVLARLDSPHVIAIHDHDEIDGTPFIVTQFVDGTDLTSHLADRGPLPARQALTLCAQLARGLADAHRAGVIHRDVKPGNVLLRNAGTPDQHAYLCDFGIARNDDGPASAATAAGLVAGTWSYLSPERTHGQPASPSSDLYALGCVLWACLTGEQPYRGTDVQVALAHQQAPVPQLPGESAFTGSLNEVIARVLAKDPAERYDDAGAFRADLERLAAQAPDDTVEGTVLRAPGAGAGASSPPPPPPPAGAPVPTPGPAPTGPSSGPGRRGRRTGRVVAGLAVLVAIALVAGLTTWLVLRDDDPAATDDAAEDAEPAIRGDLTGDGKGDLLVHQTRFGALSPLSIWTVPSSGLQFGSPQRAAAEAGQPVIGDVDGDGLPDVVWLDEEDDRMAVTVVPGEGEKWTAELPLDPAFDIKDYYAGAADLDGDGLDDLVLFGDPSEGSGLHVALAEDGGFAAPTQWYSAALEGAALRVGDVDGDGSDEVLFWGTDADNVDYLQVLRPEDGRLVAVTERALRGNAVDPILVTWMAGDVDGDGADELVVANATGRSVFVYDFADDTFEPRTRWHHTQRDVDDARQQLYDSDIAGLGLSDVDGDGKADLVTLRHKDDGGPDDELIAFVQLSDGSAFGDPASWGTLQCGSECTDGFHLVG